MRCEQARQLFDAYLDGELSPSQVTELSAHRVKCAACRRELALLEVAGRVLALSDDTTRLGGEFTDRLLACIEERSDRPWQALRKWVYFGAPLAAAAVLAFAVLGIVGSSVKTRVAGVKVERPIPHRPASDEHWQMIDETLKSDGLQLAPDEEMDDAPVDFELRDWLDNLDNDAREADQSTSSPNHKLEEQSGSERVQNEGDEPDEPSPRQD